MNSMKLKKLFTAMDWVLLHQKNGIPLHPSGEVSEWLKEHAWKVCIRETVSGVRIPLSPQERRKTHDAIVGFLISGVR